ncbi:MAG: alternative ribosome rescue aminoacyl-tRNA hydrolase ArfB [Tepidisphaeraceae bacterium]|jgi:ribosome-associated protein
MRSGGAQVELAPGVFADEGAVRFSFCRSSGPGGQNVNKVNTKAELRVAVADLRGLDVGARQRLAGLAGQRLTRDGVLIITADTARSQESNRAAVLERLRELLVQARHRPKPRRATRPTRGSKLRRLDAKKHRSDIKAGRREAAD